MWTVKTVTDRVSAEEFAKNAESAYQQIMDLIDRYQRLESAIIASNVSIYVETSRGRLSVAAAIALRNRLRISKEKEVNFEDILAFITSAIKQLALLFENPSKERCCVLS